jgi:hypothetical protein
LAYSCSCSKIIRTARARTSVENLFALLLFSIGSIHTYFGASGKLGAVQFDPWVNFDDPGLDKSWYGKNGKNDMEAMYQMVLGRFADEIESGQVEVLRDKAVDAADAIPVGSLDFIYIDGDHRYEGVTVDLEIAYNKTRAGAVIVLDDHHLGGWWGDGVVRATSEFLGRHATEFYVYECGKGQMIIKRYEQT